MLSVSPQWYAPFMSTGEASRISNDAQPETLQPRLGRVDLQKMTPDALDRHRFGITVESVHYYKSSESPERVGCAVLLSTCFDLRHGERLGNVYLGSLQLSFA